jgi:hypothetical protein
MWLQLYWPQPCWHNSSDVSILLHVKWTRSLYLEPVDNSDRGAMLLADSVRVVLSGWESVTNVVGSVGVMMVTRTIDVPSEMNGGSTGRVYLPVPPSMLGGHGGDEDVAMLWPMAKARRMVKTRA